VLGAELRGTERNDALAAPHLTDLVDDVRLPDPGRSGEHDGQIGLEQGQDRDYLRWRGGALGLDSGLCLAAAHGGGLRRELVAQSPYAPTPAGTKPPKDQRARFS